MSSRSVGVEEEFLLVEPGTGRPKAVAGTVLQAAGQAGGSDLEAELQQQQPETNSRLCQSMDDLHRELRRCRAAAASAAGRAGAQVAALGTSPVPVEPEPVRTSRAIVETEARSWREGRPVLQPRTELLRLAAWRASRSGLDAALVNPVTGQPEQARIVVNMLLDHCRDALADAGEADTVAELLTVLLARGNGAAFQRAAYDRSGRLSEVIGDAVLVTESA